MIFRLLILLFFGFVASLAIAGDTYRWEDEQGRVYYSDQPPPPGALNVRRTREYDDEEQQALPYRLQVVVDKSPVTLYVTDCGEPCDRARELMIARGVPHTLLDASKPEVQEALVTLTNGQLEVPVVSIGTTVLRGFKEDQWNSALDVAGYPSYAMIEVRPYVPQPAEQSDSQGGEGGDVAASETDELDELESDESLVEDNELDE
ncbi:MAG: glutaredoxin family protein [Betaproteobacteria bacterium]|nr:MAG: glutaredoxin family protein [Betaproteobacteria bacterium]